MPFCGICLATVEEEDMVSTLDDVCLRCYEQQMRDTEDAALLADLESELVAIKRRIMGLRYFFVGAISADDANHSVEPFCSVIPISELTCTWLIPVI